MLSEREYEFHRAAFTNGKTKPMPINENNMVPCKAFLFCIHAWINRNTNVCIILGDFLRVDVLENPTANDHQTFDQVSLRMAGMVLPFTGNGFSQ